ncbi:hypothetical protein F7P10_08710 [Actinomadura sp. WMMB 499]|nr:hypothetical protein F7P10_08710 [Actinomadura sp. WMMB 499]
MPAAGPAVSACGAGACGAGVRPQREPSRTERSATKQEPTGRPVEPPRFGRGSRSREWSLLTPRRVRHNEIAATRHEGRSISRRQLQR